MTKEEFLSKLKTGETCCYIGKVIHDRYSTVLVDGKFYRAHKLAYALVKGAIPKGLLVCHRCDVPGCINPDHLFLGTPSQNIQDSVNKGRWAKVGTTRIRKFYSGEVWLMRKLYNSGVSLRKIAKMFITSHQSVGTIVHHINYIGK